MMTKPLKSINYLENNTLKLKFIEIYTHKQNFSSIKLLEKNDPDNVNNVVYAKEKK